MKIRRITFLLLWFLSLWIMLYSGKTVYFYFFFILTVVFLLSWVQLALSITSLRLKSELSAQVAEKNQQVTWNFIPTATHWPVAGAKILLEIPDAALNRAAQAFVPISLGFRETIAIPVDLESAYCGSFTMEIKSIEFKDIFGLWRLRISPKHYPTPSLHQVTVLPRATVFSHTNPLYDEIMLPMRKTRERAEPAGVREYVPGDQMRGIHWKFSARMGKLHTKEYETGARELHLIYIDLSAPQLTGNLAARSKDYLLCSTAGLCRTLLVEHIPLLVLCYDPAHGGRCRCSHLYELNHLRLFLARCNFVPEIPSEYKDTVSRLWSNHHAAMTVFSLAHTASSLSFLLDQPGVSCAANIYLIDDGTKTKEQESLLHLFADRGLHTSLLPLPAKEVTNG